MRERILVVEDDELIRESLEIELSAAGYEVTLADCGERAIELAASQSFDLVICDVRMPDKDGLETLGELKQSCPEARSIVITGYANPKVPGRAARLGVNDYLMKPFTREQILESVRATLDTYLQELKRKRGSEGLTRALTGILEFSLSHPPEEKFRQTVLRLADCKGFSLQRTRLLNLASLLIYLPLEELAGIEELKPISLFLRHRQENWDGTGALGLAGHQIPLEARILRAAEVYSSGLTESSKAALDPELLARLLEPVASALDKIESGAGALLRLAQSYLAALQPDFCLRVLDRVTGQLAPDDGVRRDLLRLQCWVQRKDHALVLEQAPLLWRQAIHQGLDLEAARVALAWAECAGDVGGSVCQEALKQAEHALEMWEAFDELVLCRLLAQDQQRSPDQDLNLLRDLQKLSRLELLDKHPELASRLWTRLLNTTDSQSLYAIVAAEAGKILGCLTGLLQSGQDSLQLKILDLLALFPDREVRDLMKAFSGQKSAAGAKSSLLLQSSSPEQTLQVFLLGRFRLARNGQNLEEDLFTTRKITNLFAYLCSRRGQSLPEDSLAELFWPESSRALHSLQNGISQIRKVLRELVGEAAASSITKKRSGYSMQAVAAVWVDSEDFLDLCQQGRRRLQAGRAEEAVPLLKRAELLFQGEFLQGVFEEWTGSDRLRLRSEWQSLLLDLGRYFFERKRFPVCLEYWRRAVEHDNCSEDGFLGLMLTQIALGQQAEAVKTYHQCQQNLRQELALSPSPRLMETYLKLTSGQAVDLRLEA